MGLLDKVKEAAGQVGEAAKKGVGQVQSKVEQSQLRKRADDAARQLGYLIVKERTEGSPAGAEADRLVAEVVDVERQLAEGTEESAGSPAPDASEEPPAPPTKDEGGTAAPA